MTDYLELLLERRQEEETEEPFVWKWTKGGRYAAEEPDAGAERKRDKHKKPLGERVTGWDEAHQWADVAGQLTELTHALARGEAVEKALAREVEHQEPNVTEQMVELSRAVARVQLDRQGIAWNAERQGADLAGQMAALARAVVRGKAEPVVRERGTMASAQTVEQHRMEWTHATASGIQRGLAGALDAAFERDARRYDGPLGLF